MSNRESLVQFENQIEPRLYVRRITCSTESSILLAKTGVGKICSVACGFSHIQIYFYYPKCLINRINEIYDYSIKYRINDILLINHNFIYTRLFCCAITLVIVFAWFL